MAKKTKENPIPVFLPLILGALGIGGIYLYQKKKKEQAEAAPMEPLPEAPPPEEKEKDLLEQAKEKKEQLQEAAKKGKEVIAVVTTGAGAVKTAAAAVGLSTTALAGLVGGVALGIANIAYTLDKIKSYKHALHKRKDYKEMAIEVANNLGVVRDHYKKLKLENNKLNKKLRNSAWNLSLEERAKEIHALYLKDRYYKVPMTDKAWGTWHWEYGWNPGDPPIPGTYLPLSGEWKPTKDPMGVGFIQAVQFAAPPFLATKMSRKAEKKAKEMYALLQTRIAQFNATKEALEEEIQRTDKLLKIALELKGYQDAHPDAMENTFLKRKDVQAYKAKMLEEAKKEGVYIPAFRDLPHDKQQALIITAGLTPVCIKKTWGKCVEYGPKPASYKSTREMLEEQVGDTTPPWGAFG